MTAIDRTAYPYLPANLTQDEIVEWYTPTDDELLFVQSAARGDSQQLGLLIALKCVQWLGYFPQLAEVPVAIQRYLCDLLALPQSLVPTIGALRTVRRHRQEIRAFLALKAYGQGGRVVVDAAVKKSVATMSDPADLINVALEQLNNHRYELPAFSTLDRRVNRLRHQFHQESYRQIDARLSSEQRRLLDSLLQVLPHERQSAFTRLKATPGRATLKQIRRWEQRLDWLNSSLDARPLLSNLTYTKIKLFAAQAHALELGDMRDIRDAPKRYTLLLCLLQHAQVTTRDQLATMFLKRIRLIHRNANERLSILREQYRALTEGMVTALSEIVQHATDIEDDRVLGKQVRQVLKSYGGVQQLAGHYKLVSAYHNNNYLPLLWDYYRTHRALLFRLMQQLSFRAATQDRAVLEALQFIRQHLTSRRQYVPRCICQS